jgi:Domain of unknown function (DUF4190)/GYF domain 2
MYKVIGADGRTYGPINIEVLTQWATQGRINPQTRVQPEGATDWIAASECPELQGIFASLRSAAPAGGTSAGVPAEGIASQQQKGMAITSMVLGIISLLCLGGPFTGIPAVICGHIAHSRSRRSPAEYGGGGMALAGLIMGYVSLAVTIVVIAILSTSSAMLLPALSQAKSRAQMINCSNNMKQIGLAFKTWEIDHSDQFPFNVKTNAGGTLELCQRGADGFEIDPVAHFLVMSNELSTPRILVCPADTKQPVQDWRSLAAANISYRLRSGEKVNSQDPQQVLAVCPIHNNVLRVDGSVQSGTPTQRVR